MTPAENSSGAQPLLYAFAAFALGIAVAEYFVAAVWIVIFAAALISAFAFRKRSFVFAFLMVLFVSLGGFGAGLSADKTSDGTLRTMLDSGEIATDMPVEYEGVVERLPDSAQDAA